MNQPPDKHGERLAELAELAWILDTQGRKVDSQICTNAYSSIETLSYMPGLRQAEKLLRENGFEKSAKAIQKQINVLESNPAADTPVSSTRPNHFAALEKRGLYMPPGILVRLIKVANCTPREQVYPDDARYLVGVLQELTFSKSLPSETPPSATPESIIEQCAQEAEDYAAGAHMDKPDGWFYRENAAEEVAKAIRDLKNTSDDGGVS